jgi:hypothetical protein
VSIKEHTIPGHFGCRYSIFLRVPRGRLGAPQEGDSLARTRLHESRIRAKCVCSGCRSITADLEHGHPSSTHWGDLATLPKGP